MRAHRFPTAPVRLSPVFFLSAEEFDRGYDHERAKAQREELKAQRKRAREEAEAAQGTAAAHEPVPGADPGLQHSPRASPLNMLMGGAMEAAAGPDSPGLDSQDNPPASAPAATEPEAVERPRMGAAAAGGEQGGWQQLVVEQQEQEQGPDLEQPGHAQDGQLADWPPPNGAKDQEHQQEEEHQQEAEREEHPPDSDADATELAAAGDFDGE